MPKNVVIVESPAKAKTINKFLGRDYCVKACMGHVRDLPEKKLGIEIENGFKPSYQIIASKKNTIKELSRLAAGSRAVYLATDLDREGEAIAWHLAEALKLPPEKVFRVIFNEITASAIHAAFEQPGRICMDKVYAQQARRILDRLVGYKLSPLLWEKITRGLSAGRVQSVAVKLIVHKEKEIAAFVPREYWKITATLTPLDRVAKFNAELKKADGRSVTISNNEMAQQILAELEAQHFNVAHLKRNERREKAPPPFTTSQLQQQASIRLRFSAKRTMAIAQQLYEGLDVGAEGPVGLITYMRTDSYHVSQEALRDSRHYIQTHYPPQYLPARPNQHLNKKNAQGAHEAIRPTSCDRTPESLAQFLSPEQLKLYRLIWERFLASQMTPARYALTTVQVQAGRFLFEAKGRETLFAGHTIFKCCGSEEEQKKDNLLPNLQEGERLQALALTPSQHFTQPPPRYSEATLVKTLEAKGIGRPSTYAPIISTIQMRGYVQLQERKFRATELGIKVTEHLEKHFPQILDVSFTSQMENNLDLIESGKVQWVQLLQDFYQVFNQSLQRAYQEMENLKKNPEVSPYKCPNCGQSMIYKYNRQGKFLGCSGFPECKTALSLDENGEPFVPRPTDIRCPQCGRPMLIQLGRRGKFLGCSGFPQCRHTMALSPEGKPLLPEQTDIQCEKCGRPMVIRVGRRGKFLACSGYPQCRNTKSVDKEGRPLATHATDEICDKCGKPMVVKFSRGRPFLACSGYPQCRNPKPLPKPMTQVVKS